VRCRRRVRAALSQRRRRCGVTEAAWSGHSNTVSRDEESIAPVSRDEVGVASAGTERAMLWPEGRQHFDTGTSSRMKVWHCSLVGGGSNVNLESSNGLRSGYGTDNFRWWTLWPTEVT
jgi:hypothetical protein